LFEDGLAVSELSRWVNTYGDYGDGYQGVEITIDAEADTYIRTDLDIRRNDNYGCEGLIAVGTSRGGGGTSYGAPDAMRALVRFDLSGIGAKLETRCSGLVDNLVSAVGLGHGYPGEWGGARPVLERAVLELTLVHAPNTYDGGMPDSLYTVDVHRVTGPGPLTPFLTWVEGNGREADPSTPDGSGCEHVDPAFGVAWVGALDSGDENNQPQPTFDPEVVASASIDQATDVGGDVIRWEITPLARAWLDGSVPNHGLLLRDVTSDGSFRGVRFGAREGLIFSLYPDVVEPPRIILTFAGGVCGR
jgi:hypothetical protein